MSIRVLALALALLSSNLVLAEEGHYYLGVDIGDFGYSQEGYASPDNAKGYVLRLGYDFNNWLAIEGHYADPEDYKYSSANLSTNSLSAFARLNLRFKRATLYGIAGATRVSASVTAPGLGAASDTSSALAYGAGLDIYGSKDTAITFAFIRYYDKKIDGAKNTIDATTIGITHYFGDRPRIYKRY